MRTLRAAAAARPPAGARRPPPAAGAHIARPAAGRAAPTAAAAAAAPPSMRWRAPGQLRAASAPLLHVLPPPPSAVLRSRARRHAATAAAAASDEGSAKASLNAVSSRLRQCATRHDVATLMLDLDKGGNTVLDGKAVVLYDVHDLEAARLLMRLGGPLTSNCGRCMDMMATRMCTRFGQDITAGDQRRGRLSGAPRDGFAVISCHDEVLTQVL
eukprot:gene31077-26763_t